MLHEIPFDPPIFDIRNIFFFNLFTAVFKNIQTEQEFKNDNV